MAIFLTKSNSIFLHIPKTGGTWFRHAIKASGVEHIETPYQHGAVPLLLRHSMTKEDLANRRIFTIVRHPVTWYQSRWCFRVQYGWHAEHPLDMACASNDFPTFVDNVLKFKPTGWVNWIYSQYNDHPAKQVDFVARTENLIEDCVRILKELGEEFDEEKFRNYRITNDSSLGGYGSKYWAKYTPELFDRVMAVEQEVITRYYPDYEIDRDEFIGDPPYA